MPYLTHKTLRIRQLTLAAIFVVASLALATLAGAVAPAPKKNTHARIPASLSEKWGIDITGIHMSAHNYMVDFRYRVLDADKAMALFDRQTKPYLIDQTSGKVLAVPNTAKLGPLRNSNQPQEGKIYWMFFGNRGGLIDTGSKVTVVIGDFRAENLVVE
ncbi:putative transmembrane protein [Desulfosarcina cetonica]|uniref:hypothetical protein n=1 Tax=Desulfosarcina cetonica TaxID=90730 RepID=UPI0006D0AFAD|nr:hypothetical protein [Desulfosarcina cetonica]VTR67363.1 putative transmembrane protein [Desulfosarcina cetonica]